LFPSVIIFAFHKDTLYHRASLNMVKT
jgi:hypothetical protein